MVPEHSEEGKEEEMIPVESFQYLEQRPRVSMESEPEESEWLDN